MAATRIMVIRHAEKPGTYDGLSYAGVQADGTKDKESLVTLGWERAGGLVGLFAPPWGSAAGLSLPASLFAADPAEKSHGKQGDDEPSQRPYQTITALAARLDLAIDTSFSRDHYKHMADAALACAGVVLIAWQHEDIPSIGAHLLKHTGASGIALPTAWPDDRYDLVWVFDRPAGSGPVTGFAQVPQRLLAGDLESVLAD
jgi:hypothetical protein